MTDQDPEPAKRYQQGISSSRISRLNSFRHFVRPLMKKHRLARLRRWCSTTSRERWAAFKEKFSKLASWLDNCAVVKLLKALSAFSVVFAVAFWFSEMPKRRQAEDDSRKTKHYQAWTVINSARGTRSDGGRTKAVTELLADGVPLTGIDLSHALLLKLVAPNPEFESTNQSEFFAHSAEFTEADFRDTRLQERSDLKGATFNKVLLGNAQFRGAFLQKSKFRGASGTNTSFYRTALDGADFTEASLEAPDLTEATLNNAEFVLADLLYAKLRGANVRGASFWGADLRWADVTGLREYRRVLNMTNANVYGITNLAFVQWAIQHGARADADHDWRSKVSTLSIRKSTIAPPRQ